MKVVWSIEARRNLRAITDYIARDSPVSARKVAARLLLRSRELGESPLIGRRLAEYPGDDVRELLYRPWRIIYRLTPGSVEIVTIRHYRQLLPEASDLMR